jgi:uncharacterized protein YciI
MPEAPKITYYVVTRGPAWERDRAMREQERWEDHAAFMDGLAEEGFIVLGGPLGDGTRFLHVVAAAGELDVEARFGPDPWTELELLRLASIEPWQILLRTTRPF